MTCSLPTDALCVCFTSLSLGQLVNSKGVCKQWANAIRRTIRSAAWRNRGSNQDLMARVPARYALHESAEQAFATLMAANRLDKRLITRKCKQIAAIYDVLPTRLGGTAENVVFAVFKQGPLKLFTKSVRVVQQAETDRIFIFSDVYDVNVDALNSFALKCNEAGLEVFAFEWDYPGDKFHKGNYHPPAKSMMATGYWQIYRGKLAGFVV